MNVDPQTSALIALAVLVCGVSLLPQAAADLPAQPAATTARRSLHGYGVLPTPDPYG
jgi:hypothetical protein